MVFIIAISGQDKIKNKKNVTFLISRCNLFYKTFICGHKTIVNKYDSNRKTTNARN